MTQFVSIFKN